MKDTIKIQYKGQPGNGVFYYIRLGAFLKYIQDNLMYIVEIEKDNTAPLLKFDTEVETNLMFIENLQVSVDPNICLINRTITDLSNKESFNFTNQNGQEAEPFESTLFGNKKHYGQIMNIYVHMKWILLKLDELKDTNTGKVVLIDFLNNILSSINSALGGVNNLEANIDETTNTVIIRDKNPLPNMDLVISTLNKFYTDKGINKQISNESVIFDLYGYSTDQPKLYNSTGHASFIKDFSFTTEITPQLSTMLTVGATADGKVVGENSTAFSKFNAGLEDRFKKKISTPIQSGSANNVEAFINDLYPSPNTTTPTPENSEDTQIINDLEKEQKLLIGKYAQTYVKYIAYLRKLSSNNGEFQLNEGEPDTYKSALSNFITYSQQLRQITNKIIYTKYNKLPAFLPGTGFIPFNMSLTMDGLSGMKIYNKFNINTEYLPTNYPKTAEFLIKNIIHKIENNKWTTTLESIVTVKGEYESKGQNNTILGNNNAPSSTSSTSTTSTSRYDTFKDNNLFNLRPNSGTQFNGYVGKKEGFRGNTSIGYFAVYDTKQNGIRAGMKNISNYFTRKKLKTIKDIITVYAPPGENNTESYILSVTNYLKQNWNSNITSTTVLNFAGALEINPNNIKMFKTLVKAIIKQEGILTLDLITSIDSFDIKNLA